MSERVVLTDKLFDLCDEEFARFADPRTIALLCEEAGRSLQDDEGLELVGEFFAAASFGE